MEKKPVLLIVEDDDLTQKVYEAMFSKSYNLIICKNELDFYPALNKSKIDIFLIDISLVGTKDGIQLIKELRNSKEYFSAPIIVVTANAFKKDEEVAIKAGATKFIRKPFDNKQLMEQLEISLN